MEDFCAFVEAKVRGGFLGGKCSKELFRLTLRSSDPEKYSFFFFR